MATNYVKNFTTHYDYILKQSLNDCITRYKDTGEEILFDFLMVKRVGVEATSMETRELQEYVKAWNEPGENGSAQAEIFRKEIGERYLSTVITGDMFFEICMYFQLMYTVKTLLKHSVHVQLQKLRHDWNEYKLQSHTIGVHSFSIEDDVSDEEDLAPVSKNMAGEIRTLTDDKAVTAEDISGVVYSNVKTQLETISETLKTQINAYGDYILQFIKQQKRPSHSEHLWLKDLHIQALQEGGTVPPNVVTGLSSPDMIIKLLKMVDPTYQKHTAPTTFQTLVTPTPSNVPPIFYALAFKVYKIHLAFLVRLYAIRVLYEQGKKLAGSAASPPTADIAKQNIFLFHNSFVRQLNELQYLEPMAMSFQPYAFVQKKVDTYASSLYIKYANLTHKILQFFTNAMDKPKIQERIAKYIPSIPSLFKTNIPSSPFTHFSDILTNIYFVKATSDKSIYKPTLKHISNETGIGLLIENLSQLAIYRDGLDKERRIYDVLFYKSDEPTIIEFMKLQGLSDADTENPEKAQRMLDSMNKCTVTADQFASMQSQLQEHYLTLVEFYENVAGAVRVYVRLKDNEILANCKEGAEYIVSKECPIEYNKRTSTWTYQSADIKNIEDASIQIRDDITNKEKTYGPFFKVIPPFTAQFQRMNNEIIANEMVGVEEMTDLLSRGSMNLVLFTYGYSGSGKTYTLFGDVQRGNPNNALVYKYVEQLLKKGCVVTLSNVHSLYGYLDATQTYLNVAKHTSAIIGNQINETTNTIPYSTRLSEEGYVDQINSIVSKIMVNDVTSINLDALIKNTPNNPSSSRGFLIFEFDIQKPEDKGKNKLVVVDMAGNESPYDILTKTVPTFFLPGMQNRDTNFLTSKNIVNKDIIFHNIYHKLQDSIEGVIGYLTTKMLPIFSSIYNPSGFVRHSATLKSDLNQKKTIVNIFTKDIETQNGIQTYIKDVLPDIDTRVSQEYESIVRYVECCFQTLQYDILYRFFAQVKTLKIDQNIVAKEVEELLGILGNKLETLVKIYKVNDTYVGKIKAGSKNRLLIKPKMSIFDIVVNTSDSRTKPVTQLNINLRDNAYIHTIMFMAYACREVYEQASSAAAITVGDQELTKNIEMKILRKDTRNLEVLTMQKYILDNHNLLIGSDTFVNAFSNKKYLIENSTFSLVNNQGTIIRKGATGLNDLFDNTMLHIQVYGETERMINAPAEYFERIMREGFYINQVNYELMRFFYQRMMGTDSDRRQMVAEGGDHPPFIDYETLILENYDPLVHTKTREPYNTITANTSASDQPWCMTNILQKLADILGDDEDKNKYIMISNIRVEKEKFRAGAIQTLDLIKNLSST